MVELHMSFWKLLGYAGALYLAAVFVIRGQLLKHRLRRELIGNPRRISKAVCREMA